MFLAYTELKWIRCGWPLYKFRTPKQISMDGSNIVWHFRKKKRHKNIQFARKKNLISIPEAMMPFIFNEFSFFFPSVAVPKFWQDVYTHENYAVQCDWSAIFHQCFASFFCAIVIRYSFAPNELEQCSLVEDKTCAHKHIHIHVHIVHCTNGE